MRPLDKPAAQPGVPRVWVSEDGSLTEAFAALASSDAARHHGRQSYWWTLGGEHHPAQLWAVEGMPRPELFATFINGLGGGRS